MVRMGDRMVRKCRRRLVLGLCPRRCRAHGWVTRTAVSPLDCLMYPLLFRCQDGPATITLLSILACPSTCPIHRVGTSLLKRINHPRDLVGLILACPCPLVTSLHPSTRLVPPRLLPLCRTRRILHIRPPHHMRIL